MQFFTAEKIKKQLADVRQAVYRDIQEIPSFKFREGPCPGAEAPAYDDSDWQAFHTGSTWGGYDVQAWFRAIVPIPPEWNDKRLYLRFLVGPRDGGDSTAEALLYVNGQPLQGLDVWHEEVWLPPEHLQDDHIHIAIKAWSGVLGVPDRRRFKVAQLIWIDEATEQLYQTSRVLLEAIQELDENDLRRVRLLQALNDAFHELDLFHTGSPEFYCSAQNALALLQERLAALQGMDTRLKPTVYATGHAHIDMAWLWRLSHTREKAARTFSTTLHLMRQYPEYRFMHSSPQLYDYLEQDYPEIFKQVQERIKAGQWEITGGMWVEPDVNIPSGESLVRQFLLGQRYIREKFGMQSRLLWLPDAFGYSWALPQIARQSGIDYFLTSKISWNQFNRFPYDTFRWRGIDGTELLTYFITTPSGDGDPTAEDFHLTYNGQLSPMDVKGTWDFYQQKEVNDELLTLFGWGDGGGGPTKEMLESGRVLRDLPGFPNVRQELSERFFAHLAERLKEEALPVWDDELYLELHRGTYTSQAYNKRANRLSEILYHNAEWLNAVTDILRQENDYPAQCLHEGWQLILLNQFHDILPGSSIREVYEDSREDYERVFEIGQSALQGAQQRLQDALRLDRDSLIVYNPLSWQRNDPLSLPWSPALAGKVVEDGEGNVLPVQIVQERGERRLLLQAPDVPSLGYAAYALIDAGPEATAPAETMTVTPTLLENEYYRLQLNNQGQLTSIWDKQRQREVLASGARGNVLQAFVDRPLKFDAWDIDIYYQEKAHEVTDLVEAEVEECGPLRGALRLRWCFRDSVITQRLILYAHSPRIDFETEVDWQESQILLKVAFPVAVRATSATYDIQFGNIQRPTHWNTSWDYARFEVVGHKWADLSENDYGVALLNDCKYGYDIKDNVMRLTLIKSAVRPDPQADKGHHRFTYSLLPHAGDWRHGDVLRQGYELNMPLLAALAPAQPAGALPSRYTFAEVDADNVILETVKRAEDGDGWIVRLYESSQRRRHNVRLTFGSTLCDAVACNLLEEAVEDPTMEREGNSLIFAMKPYEIKSFRVWLEVDRT